MIMRTWGGGRGRGVWVLSTGDEKGLGNVIFKILKVAKESLQRAGSSEGRRAAVAPSRCVPLHPPTQGKAQETPWGGPGTARKGHLPQACGFGERAGWGEGFAV